MPRDSSWDHIYRRFMLQHCDGQPSCEAGENNYYAFLNKNGFDDTKPYPENLPKMASESYSWAVPIEKALARPGAPKNLFRATAINVGETGAGHTPILPGWENRMVGQIPHEHRIYDESELRAAARSITGQSVDIDHGHKLWHGEEIVGEVLIGEYQDQRVETYGYVYQDDLYEHIGKEIQFVSTKAMPFWPQQIDGLLMRGLYFERLSLLWDEHPGDVNTRVEKYVPTPVLESLMVTPPTVGFTATAVTGNKEMSTKIGVPESIEEQLRTKYGISADKSKATQFLYAPEGSKFSDWAFPVRDNDGILQRDLVEFGIQEAALVRFHQTSPEIQGKIKDELCSRAKELGIETSICGMVEAVAGVSEARVKELITIATTEAATKNAAFLAAGLKQTLESLKPPVPIGGAKLAPSGVGAIALTTEEQAKVLPYAIRNTPLRDIMRLRSGR